MLVRTLPTSTPATVAVGAHGYGYIFTGNGNKPQRVDLTDGTCVDMGIPAPSDPPSVTPTGDPKLYVARIDVVDGGNMYHEAPRVTVGTTTNRGAEPCKARAYLRGNAVSEVVVLDHGRGFAGTPPVALSDTHSTGAQLTAVLDTTAPQDRITAVESSQPSTYPCLPFWSPLDSQVCAGWYGSQFWGDGLSWSMGLPDGHTIAFAGRRGRLLDFDITTAGGTPAKVRVTFDTVAVPAIGGANAPVSPPVIVWYCTRIVETQIIDGGSGFTGAVEVVIEDGGRGPSLGCCGSPGCSEAGLPHVVRLLTQQEAVLRGVASATTLYPIKEITVANGGQQYNVPPSVTVAGAGGASLTAEVKDGAITAIKILDGGLYATPPDVLAIEGGATAVAITRPHIRGKYDCFYRYVDDTPASRGGPIPSSLSPVATVDAGDGAGELVWAGIPDTITAGDRQLKVEYWRTTSNQSYTIYRVYQAGDVGFVDDLTDAEVTDYDRPGYLAMSILLPNGELNANRFGVPPTDRSVAVMYQDRLWYACDTNGDEPNSLGFSELNEPESCPDINEIILQTNVKGDDHITALIPYGSSLGIMQTRHAYRLSYVSQPIIDANIQIAAFRGCLNQRCWDEYEGIIYVMDNDGVYALDQGGAVQPLSLGLDQLFRYRIDFSKSRWFSVVADRRAGCLRVSVRYDDDGPGEYPTRQLCFGFDAKGWWEERYPTPLVGGASLRGVDGNYSCLYGTTDGAVYALNSGNTDYADGTITDVTVTNAGSGYSKPPAVTVTGDGTGAVIESAISPDGTLLGLYVRHGGYGYTNPQVVIAPPEDGTTATATCVASDGPVGTHCWIKTGNMEYPNDSLAPQPPDGSRNVAMLFTPTNGPCDLKLRMYYNNLPYPRVNVVRRDRGTGVVQDDREPATTLDMDAGRLPDSVSSGVCRALFTEKTVDDFRGNDRHVAAELSTVRGAAGRVVIHQIDMFGVPTPGA